jgi:hypothetical protein
MMATNLLVRRQHGAVMLAVLVILSLGATVALAGAPSSRLFQSPPSVPPPNDSFVDATLIDTFPFNTTVDTEAATTEPGEPMSCETMGWTVWYKLTPTVTATYEVNTSGTSLYQTDVSIWQGTVLETLSPVTCGTYSPYLTTFTAQAGVTYYIQLGTPNWLYGGVLALNISVVPPPSNDDFANAILVGSVPYYSEWQNTKGATVEPGEPLPTCAYSELTRSIWYVYTPAQDGWLTAYWSSYFNPLLGVYSGSDLSALTEIGCINISWRGLLLSVHEGLTYYFQISSLNRWEEGDNVQFQLTETPMPIAGFSWSPYDPSKYDTVQFCDQSYDQADAGFTDFWWEFGDGDAVTGNCASHQYAAASDYTVWHKVQTWDGRTDDVTQQVAVRTHDVAITKFTAPKSASAGQTRQIVVGVRNYNYTEDVQVDLYKSSPNTYDGYTWIGSLRQRVAVRSGNRTTDFNFSYTFTSDDAKVGKLTFRSVATIQNARDALPADNEAISSPTKVAGK